MGQGQRELDEVPLAAVPQRSSGLGVTTVAAVLIAVVVAGVLFLRDRLDEPRASEGSAPSGTATEVTPTADPAAERRQALDELLATRSEAVLGGDEAAWVGTVDAASPDFAARQSETFRNLADVPFADWHYELAGNGPTLSSSRLAELAADDVWVARVVLEYELQASGTGVVRREQYLTMVRRNERWLLADDKDGGTAVDLWDLGHVAVVRGDRSLVIGTAEQDVLDRFATETDQAARRVDDVWGAEWPRTVVVMVPSDQAQMAALLARDDPAGLDQIAAVTTGEVGIDSSATSADRVIVNPDGFADLGEIGRGVVLAHEITHVATRATTTAAVPIWLSEGFADYVAYSGTGLSTRVIAKDVLDAVREGRGPTALPTARDFDPTVTNIAPAYSGAWLAAHLIAERHGERALLAFYRSIAGASISGTPAPASTPGGGVASQPAVDAAFAQVLSTDEATFTREWLAELERLAR